MFDRQFNDGGELVVLVAAETHISGIDPVLGQDRGAFRHLLQQRVAVVMEVPDQRHLAGHHVEAALYFRHCGRSFQGIDRDPDQFRTSTRQLRNLGGRCFCVGRIGIGHRLHNDRVAATDLDIADTDCRRGAADCRLGIRCHFRACYHFLKAHGGGHRSSPAMPLSGKPTWTKASKPQRRTAIVRRSGPWESTTYCRGRTKD